MFKVHCILYLCLLMLLVYTAPLEKEKESEAKILIDEYKVGEPGILYEFSFVTSNRITRTETGIVMNKGQPNEFISVSGRYTYFDPEDKQQVVDYIADDNGYKILPPPDIEKMPPPGVVVATLLGK